MSAITIKVINAQLVAKGLANIRAAIPKISDNTIKKAADAIAREMKVYPPPPVGSRYVRTGKLRDSVKVKKMASGYSVNIDPIQKGKHYGRYVIGYAYGTGQANIHVGRWKLLRDVTEKHVENLPPMVEEHIRLVARREKL